MTPVFFSSQKEFHDWLRKNHSKEKEISVGFYKRHTGKPTLTWKESVDEALSFGWIDGIRRSLGADSYSIRFTPRKPRSIWSTVNIKRASELEALGKMTPAGLEAFRKRDEKRTNLYSFERATVEFTPQQKREFKVNKKAWAFFQSMPPSYQKPATWWVISARKEETRTKRLQTLIDDSEHGRKIKPLSYNKK